MENKKPWLSKTLWTNLLVAIIAFFPGAQEWIAQFPQIFILLFAGINMVLRLATKDKITLQE